jgi:hypothetical protein
LISALDVAREQNDSCGLEARQQGIEARGYLSSIETDDEELPKAGWQGGAHFP